MKEGSINIHVTSVDEVVFTFGSNSVVGMGVVVMIMVVIVVMSFVVVVMMVFIIDSDEGFFD